ncbi:MAG: metal ABC transporter permease [Fretibacterium sp.]|nr:metal ABC transporter permease [Fretibacterium sp.]
MSGLVGKAALYWQFPFVRYALVVGMLIALCSSLLGVTLVLKRFSFIGDGLSHVAFGAIAVASVLNVANNMPVVLSITILCAVLLLRTGQSTSIKGDAVMAMTSVGSLAVGYLLMNIFSTSPNLSGDVCSTLFGSTSILTLTGHEVWLSVGLSASVVLVFCLFYNKIFAVTFDEDFARAAGTKAGAYNLIIAIVVAVVIVLAMNLVGSLLVSALVIFPALSAMRVFKSFWSVTVCSACRSVGCALLGMGAAILAGTPVGATVVAADMAAFGVFYIAGKFLIGKSSAGKGPRVLEGPAHLK